MNLFLTWLGLLLLHSYVASFFFDSGEVFSPSGTIFVNDTVNITCRAGENKPYEASSLYFRFNGRNVSENLYHTVGNNSIRLLIEGATKANHGTYYCHTDAIQGELHETAIGNTIVKVYDKPDPPDRLSCVSMNFRDLNCTWCPDPIPADVEWDVKWSIFPSEHFPCDVTYVCTCYICGSHEPAKQTCQDNGHYESNPHFKRFWNYNITVNTRVKHVTVMKTYSIQPNLLVKPNKVNSPTVGVIGSRSVVLKWNCPNGLNFHRAVPLNYLVSWSNTWGDKNETIVEGTDVDDCSNTYTAVGLVPFTDYTFTVIVRPRNGGFDSEATILNARTLSDKPDKPPLIYRGSFNRELNYVHLYWRHVSPKYYNGDPLNCSVNVDQQREFVLKDCSHVHSTTVNKLDVNTGHNVSISMVNKKGSSPAAVWHIPPMYEANLRLPRDVTVEYYPESEIFKFQWTPPEDKHITSYTIYYGKNKGPGFKDLSVVMFAADPNTTTYNLSIPAEVDVNPRRDYVAAMSAESRTHTSGMTSKLRCLCVYGEKPARLRTQEGLRQDKERSLTVTWSVPACSEERQGRASHVVISWRTATSSENTSWENVTVPVEPARYWIENLQPFTVYIVELTAVTQSGEMSFPSRINNITTTPSRPGDSPQNLNITVVRETSMSISWTSPTKPNGRITDYRIGVTRNAETDFKIVPATNIVMDYNLTGLKPYTSYSIEVSAINTEGESDFTAPLQETTLIAAPAQVEVKSFRVNIKNNARGVLIWSEPEPVNGPLESMNYLIKAEWGETGKMNWTVPHRHLQHNVDVPCSSSSDKLPVTVTVTAVSLGRLVGPHSVPKGEDFCIPQETFTPAWVLPVVLVCVFVIIIILVLLSWYFGKKGFAWFWNLEYEDPKLTPMDNSHPNTDYELKSGCLITEDEQDPIQIKTQTSVTSKDSGVEGDASFTSDETQNSKDYIKMQENSKKEPEDEDQGTESGPDDMEIHENGESATCNEQISVESLHTDSHESSCDNSFQTYSKLNNQDQYIATGDKVNFFQLDYIARSPEVECDSFQETDEYPEGSEDSGTDSVGVDLGSVGVEMGYCKSEICVIDKDLNEKSIEKDDSNSEVSINLIDIKLDESVKMPNENLVSEVDLEDDDDYAITSTCFTK